MYKKGHSLSRKIDHKISEYPSHIFERRPGAKLTKLFETIIGRVDLNSKPWIAVKIVSGVKQGGIPDTIKMSEAAGQ
jgi:hypothetical protein